MIFPDTPWPPVNDMIKLKPGTVTAVASLPGVGRSTFTLNMALHNALQGKRTLYTSSEIVGEELTSKAVTALYGIDLRHRETPLGGWESFSARTKQQVESIPLHLHEAIETTPEKAYTAGTVGADRKGQRLTLWFLDSLTHFSAFTTDGRHRDHEHGAEKAMAQLRRIAEQEQIAVVVTARAENEEDGQPLTLEHVEHAVATLSDQVLMLHREGAWWTSDVSDTATVDRLKPPHEGTAVLRFLPRLCRFAHFGINV
ncbi:DnaB-like helicase C-terminal domain-containing protein [Streptomyces sparsogenes]|uniref:DnaB-like helicase C-terminal domain-containing protein n=1 Tax=Streptomyces sparsogenes TaxID=67365 RepID=UPI0033E44326